MIAFGACARTESVAFTCDLFDLNRGKLDSFVQSNIKTSTFDVWISYLVVVVLDNNKVCHSQNITVIYNSHASQNKTR